MKEVKYIFQSKMSKIHNLMIIQSILMSKSQTKKIHKTTLLYLLKVKIVNMRNHNLLKILIKLQMKIVKTKSS